MEIDTVVTSDALDGVDYDFSKRVGDAGVDLGVEGGAGDVDEKVAAKLGLLDSEVVQELEDLNLSLLDTVNDDTGVDTLAEVALGLAHELTDEEHIGRGAIADDVILGGGGAADHSGSGVLDLHLVEEDATVLSELDLASSTNEHLEGTLGTKVGLEDLLETLSGVDVDAESGSLADDIGLGVNQLQRGHACFILALSE